MLGRVVVFASMVSVALGCNSVFAESCLAPYLNMDNDCSSLSWTTDALCLCQAANVTCNMKHGCRSDCIDDTSVKCPCEYTRFEHELVFTAEYYVIDNTLWARTDFKGFFHQKISPWVESSWTVVDSSTDTHRSDARLLSVVVTIPHNTAVPSSVITQLREMLTKFPELRQLTAHGMSLKSSVSSKKGKDYATNTGISTGGIVGVSVGGSIIFILVVVFIICGRVTSEETKELKARKSKRLQSFKGSQSNMMRSKSGRSYSQGSTRKSDESELKEANPEEEAAANENAPDLV